jgi:dolichol-phosphate mannosyltransferase
MSGRPDFSVILTCYREEQSIRDFHGRVTGTMRALGRPYEILMVNDGSPDGTLAILNELFDGDPATTVLVDFEQNSGQAAGHTVGIAEARGRALVFIDSDLQLDPEDIPLLVAAYDRGMDLVGGRRARRQDPPFRKAASAAANWLTRRLTGTPLRDVYCCFKIIDADIVKSIGYGPRRLFRILEVMRRCPRCCEVPVSHHPRPHGRSGWTVLRLAGLMLDAVRISLRPDRAPHGDAGDAPLYAVRTLRRKPDGETEA